MSLSSPDTLSQLEWPAADIALLLQWLTLKSQTPATYQTYSSVLVRLVAYLVHEEQVLQLRDMQLIHLQGFSRFLYAIPERWLVDDWPVRGACLYRKSQLSLSSRESMIRVTKACVSWLHECGELPANYGKQLGRVKATPWMKDSAQTQVMHQRQTLQVIQAHQNQPKALPPVVLEFVMAQLLERYGHATTVSDQRRAARDVLLVWVGYVTALRISSIAGLRWSQFTQELNGDYWVTVLVKGGLVHQVAIAAPTYQSLTQWYQTAHGLPALPEHAVIPRLTDPLQCVTSKHLIRRYEVMRRELCASARTAGQQAFVPYLQNLTSHALRHTHATNLLNEGMSLSVVQRVLGHQSIQTTERYAQADQAALQEAASQIQQLAYLNPAKLK